MVFSNYITFTTPIFTTSIIILKNYLKLLFWLGYLRYFVHLNAFSGNRNVRLQVESVDTRDT